MKVLQITPLLLLKTLTIGHNLYIYIAKILNNINIIDILIFINDNIINETEY